MLTLNDGRNELWQWDTGRKLTVDAECSQVHFSNKVFGRSVDVDVVDGVADIPDILLQTDKELTAWAFVGTVENGYTKISKVFKVNKRNKPADYVFTPPEQTTLEEIKEKLDYLESIQDPDAIKNAVDEYLANNPIQIDEKDPTVPEWAKQTTKPKYTATEVGAVAKVNGVKPDANGNVEITIPDSGGNVDYAAYGLPILHLTGDTSAMTKDDAVDLTYVYGDRNGTVSVKWQGSSSLEWDKKNYTMKFDNAFEAKEGWGEQKKYCFKANFIDSSHARNVVNAKLWGQVVKSRPLPPNNLANLPNAGAVDGFPCIIMLNGEFHGLYTWNIPKDGWMFGMDGTEERAAIVCAEYASDATRFTATATIGDTFELEYVTNEDDAGWVQESLNTLINACINSGGSDIDTVVAKYIDWNSAIDFYCFATLIGGFDLIAKNYLLVTFDGVKWRFGAYDMDSTHGLEWTGTSFYGIDKEPMPEQYATIHKLMGLVRKYKYEELVDRYKELRAGVMSDDNVIKTFSNFIATIPAELYRADAKKWQSIPSTAASNLAQISEFYRLRAAAVDAEMYAMGAPIPILAADDSWHSGVVDPTAITKIEFVSEYSETGTETASWDASASSNPGTIKGYVNGDVVTVAVKNGAKNIMIMGGVRMFQAFKNVVEINGTEMFVGRTQFPFSMEQMCYLLSKLTTPVHIPEGANNISSAFCGCTALPNAPSMPSTVTAASRTFDGCKFTSAPKLPPRLTNMNQMFRYCESLVNVDKIIIPETVTVFTEAFNGCVRLEGTMKINAVNISSYNNAFRNAPTGGRRLNLVGTSTQLAELAATNTGGQVVVAI